MRVNIQYSIDTEELPEMARQLVDKGIEAVNMDALENLAQAEDLLTLDMAQSIDRLRQSLAITDTLFQDAHNIIMGWLHYQSAPNSSERAPPSTSAIGAEELQEKLAAFKESLAAQQHETTD